MEAMTKLWKNIKTKLNNEPLPEEFKYLTNGDPREDYIVHYLGRGTTPGIR